MGRKRRQEPPPSDRFAGIVLLVLALGLVGGPVAGGTFLVHDHGDEGAHRHRILGHGSAVVAHEDHTHAGEGGLLDSHHEHASDVVTVGEEGHRTPRRLGTPHRASTSEVAILAAPSGTPGSSAGPPRGECRAPADGRPPPARPSRLEVLRI